MKKLLKNHFGTIMMALGLILVLSAAGLTAYNFWDEGRAENAMAEALMGLDAIMITDLPDNSNPSMVEIPDYMLNPEKDMPELTLDRNQYVGVLEVPSLGIRLPIMSEWSYPNLKISPCRYTGSAYLNNMVIAGHNYRSHFGSLSRVRVGDEVIFTDMDGNNFIYTVAETETLKPTEIERMVNGDWDLTLFTCTLGGRTRFTARCVELIDSDM